MWREQTGSSVVNLSDVTFTPQQLSVSALGHKFCPSFRTLDSAKLSADVREGSRRMRLKELYHNEESQEATPPKFYKKTFYQPPSGRVNALDVSCDTLQLLADNFRCERSPPDNLSPAQRIALRELRHLVKNRVIRISTADKGGALVVQNPASYIKEAQRQLENSDHYIRIATDPTKTVAKEYNIILEKLKTKEVIDNVTFKWAKVEPNQVRTHIFYHLPKIHKSMDNPPGRPIVSGIGGPTETLSKLADHWLRDLVESLPSYVRDSAHMLRILEDWNRRLGPFNEKVLLVTMDVESLYTNIPHSDIERSLRHFLGSSHNRDTPALDAILEVTNHVLGNNYFNFGDKTYKQISGTAMGTPMAPTVANVFMGWHESNLLSKSPVPVDASCWKRYIDDVFLLWTNTREELDDFVSFINSVHPSIKFTVTVSTSQVPFLDLEIKFRDRYLISDLHTKETDAHNFVHFRSCHPRHCIKNVPLSQYLRIRRICSLEEDFQFNAAKMTSHFVRRGYPKALLHKAKERAQRASRADTLEHQQKRKTTRVPYVVTHHPGNPPLRGWLRDLLPTLHTSTRMQEVVPEPPVVGERNCRTLKQLLMPSALPEPPGRDPPGCYHCGKRCVLNMYKKLRVSVALVLASASPSEIDYHVKAKTLSISCFATSANTRST